ncbi:hypothetical protein [Streptomyces sp. NPDC055189]
MARPAARVVASPRSSRRSCGPACPPDEQVSLDTHIWIAWSELGSLSDPVEPPQLPAVLGAMLPDGPWRDRAGA